MKTIHIKQTNLNFEREPFPVPMGFKGGYLRELWQTAVLLRSAGGQSGLGLGTQSILWSDPAIFFKHGESAGNSLMFLMTAFALREAAGRGLTHPMQLLDEILPLTYRYGRRLAGRRQLRLTFALNALVAVDNAAWMLYAAEHGLDSFDAIIPEEFRSALSFRHSKLACIPLISYGVSPADVRSAVDSGLFFMKIKIGADPDNDGDARKMLAWDQRRLSEIHEAVGNREIAWSQDKRIPYYLDANGRYKNKELLLRFLEHADRIGALSRIMLLEEPFPENYRVDVRDIPVRLVADESAHSEADARERIDMGYGAIALKPIAKTLSMSLRIARAAHERQIPCFCADLTVNPILVDWNKNMAARLAPLPGMSIGVLETNGSQNYKDWIRLQSYHPYAGASWMAVEKGLFNLGADFYETSGGILKPSRHYLEMVAE